jgi:hypothetical protein
VTDEEPILVRSDGLACGIACHLTGFRHAGVARTGEAAPCNGNDLFQFLNN